MGRYMTELAEAIDARAARLGEHAADTAPLWATRTLGPVPEDPAARADWTARASVVAAYREMHGYENPGDPIGPEPSKTSPETRADWHAALAALGAIDGMDLLGVPDEVLEVRRGLYERETAWAPAHVSEQLRLARITVTDAGARISRAEHEEQAAATEALPGMPEREAEPEIRAARQEDARILGELGLTPEKAAEPVPEHVQRVAENAAATEEVLAGLRSMPEPGEAEDDASPGEAWAAMAGRQRDSVLQPPEPLVPAAPQLAEPQIAEAELEAEA